MPPVFMLLLISFGAFILGIGIAIAVVSNKKPQSGSTDIPDDVDEAARKKLESSTRSIKEILVGLAFAVKNLDGAASKSSNTLTQVRNKLDEMSLPQDIARCQELIIAEVDKVLRSNNGLRSDLQKAKQEMTSQKKIIESLQIAASTDHLTHVDNRASFDEYIVGSFKRYRDSGLPFSILILDIDHFKGINDTYGHLTGDKVLESMANVVRSCLRSSDFIARYGGEEFVVILEHTRLEQACLIAENLRKSIEEKELILDNNNIKLTISIGCAVCQEDDKIKDLIKRADEQLYNAKNSGRNKVCPAIEQP